MTQSSQASTDTEEKVRVGSTKPSLGLPQLVYIKLYGVPKSVSIVSVIDIPVAAAHVFVRVIVYRTTSLVFTILSTSLSVFVMERIGSAATDTTSI